MSVQENSSGDYSSEILQTKIDLAELLKRYRAYLASMSSRVQTWHKKNN
jgi:hypothetical protein